MHRSLLPLALLTVAGPLLAAASAPAYGPPRLVCRFQDRRIAEASGLAAASRSNDVLFTHNDSGDTARFFAVDRQGRTLGVYTLPGARATDWEDLARGPDESGASCLFLADIGDNERSRQTVKLYRVPEPEVDHSRPGAALETPRADRFELQYPDGRRDAEALMVHPRTGQVFIVTKGAGGSGVYAAPPRLDGENPNRLRKIGSIAFGSLPATLRSLKDYYLHLLATAADLAPDGSRLVVCTYTDAYEWKIPNDDLAAALKAKPAHIPLPKLKQAEAIAYTRDGRALLVTSEGAGAPLYELPAR
jgi:hypothetical protein